MSFYVAHAGTTLQKITVAGALSDLIMPTGVTVSSTYRTRFATLAGSILASHGPTINIRIDPATLTVTPLSIPKPGSVPTTATGAAGVLTGDYLYKVSFAQISGSALVSESPLSEASAIVTLSAQKGALSAIPTSTADGVTSRKLYRTTAGGAVYFPLATIADNTTTVYTDNVADASLGSTAAATDLGNPYGTTTADYLPLLLAWKNRLWSVGNLTPDLVYFSGIDRWFAWSATNYLTLNPAGQGVSGVTAFLPRRDELGVSKQHGLWKIVGTGSESYQVIQVIAGVGVVAPESVVVISDIAYFLSEEGVYAWGSGGIENVSVDRVAAWFQTDDYFNRSRFQDAFAIWNQREGLYELHLAAAGSGVEDRWVSYDYLRRVWTGPHKTNATTPSVVAQLEDAEGMSIEVLGGVDGYLYRRHDAEFLDGSTSIPYAVTTLQLSGGEPGIEKYFGELTVLTTPQASGTLTITPTVGALNASADTAFSHDLTLDRERHGRLGVGRFASFTFSQDTASVGCEVLGYEIDPVSIVGRR